jgi:hypothetical protein
MPLPSATSNLEILTNPALHPPWHSQYDKDLAALKASLAGAEAALKEAEEAIVPPGLVRLARSASGHLNAQWAELQSNPTFGAAAVKASEVAGQVAAQASEITSKVAEQVGPYASEAYTRASSLARSASIRAVQVQEELAGVVETHMRAVPALAPYVDPVIIQAVVYALIGLPLLVLLPLLAALLGRAGGGAGGKAAGGKKGSGGGVKRGAAAGKPVVRAGAGKRV